VYRAQLFLRDYVGSFSPSLGDLDYPNRLMAPAEEVRARLASRAARGCRALNASLRVRSQKNGTADAGSGKGATARRAGIPLTGGPAQRPQRPRRSSRSWCVAGLESSAQCPTPPPPPPLCAQGPFRDMYSTWYPPLERTLMCLSKLYRCIEVRETCPLPPFVCASPIANAAVCRRADERLPVRGAGLRQPLHGVAA
jgi:hypothetical protein